MYQASVIQITYWIFVSVGFNRFRQNYSSLFIINGLFVNTCNKLQILNLQESTKPQTYESVNDIREHAPMWHKMGNRLITASDYKTYILNNYKDRIYDVYVCNNTTYTTTFYQWLQKYGKLNIDIRKYIIENFRDDNEEKYKPHGNRARTRRNGDRAMGCLGL